MMSAKYISYLEMYRKREAKILGVSYGCPSCGDRYPWNQRPDKPGNGMDGFLIWYDLKI